MWSRSSSISSRKKESVDESVLGPGVYSRSNSVGEADKRSEDYIVLKVFGITAASQNIKQDLVAVLQKKLDDKVRTDTYTIHMYNPILTRQFDVSFLLPAGKNTCLLQSDY